VTKTDFLKQLKALAEAHRDRFGYPYLPLGLVRSHLDLPVPALQKLLKQCQESGAITMTAVDAKVLPQLPTALEVIHLGDEGFVSVALVAKAK